MNLLLEFDKLSKEISSNFTKQYTTSWAQNEENTDVRVIQLDPLSMLLNNKIEANDYQIQGFEAALKAKLEELQIVNLYQHADWYVANARIEANTKEEIMKIYNTIKDLLTSIWEWFLSILDKFHDLFPSEPPVEPEEDVYEGIESLDLFQLGTESGTFFEKTVVEYDTGKVIVLLYDDMVAISLKKENATPNEIVILTDLFKSFVEVAYTEFDFNDYKVIKTNNNEDLSSAYDSFINRIYYN